MVIGKRRGFSTVLMKGTEVARGGTGFKAGLLGGHPQHIGQTEAERVRRHRSSFMKSVVRSLFLVGGFMWPGGLSTAAGLGAKTAIVCQQDSTPMETLAAREVRRYVFERTGKLLPMVTAKPSWRLSEDAIVVGRKDRQPIATVLQDQPLRATVAALQPQQYLLKTIQAKGRRIVLVVGGDEAGALYGAYRFAECLGVRFYLHGDVIPDEPIRFALPAIEEEGKPLFGLRGIQPFHDFPFGPDWWTTEDYKAYVAQLAKMRMNFIGLHCYPEYFNQSVAEPIVWVGMKGDFDDQGRVRRGYPARQNHTSERPAQGGFTVPMKTSDYHFGAALLFERDDAGSEANVVAAAESDPVEAQKALLNYCGEMQRKVFDFARHLNVKTCVGTEVPSQKQAGVWPAAVVERLRAQQADPKSPAVLREIYAGMFERIMKTHPLDYYWLWTCEVWRGQNTPAELKEVVEHFTAAYEAMQRVGAPFKLATGGWVLGPQDDRAGYDRVLPKDVPISSINTELGHNPIDPAYARIEGREKWAIPWMEDDLALANPQLWVGRTRKDAADALAYGCTGLFGIHWRTEIIAPNLAALAQAAWSQSPWNPTPGRVPASLTNTLDRTGLTPRSLHQPRGLSTADFYADWAQANFGPEAAGEIAAIFEQIDGNLPRVLSGCPCGVNADNRPWTQVAPEYAFVDALQEFRPKLKGAGNLARFDYWLDSLCYLRAAGAMECAMGQFNRAMEKVNAETDSTLRRELAKNLALPAYREVYHRFREALGLLLLTASTPGELATVAVWQQTYYPDVLEKLGAVLSKALGEALSAELQPTPQYDGPPRLIVPTVRGLAAEGEQLPLRVIVLSREPPRKANLRWRVLGAGGFTSVELRHLSGGVYSVVLPPVPAAGLEYYIQATVENGQRITFPPAAPRLNQTVVALPGSSRRHSE
jgi:hypothetical protein